MYNKEKSTFHQTNKLIETPSSFQIGNEKLIEDTKNQCKLLLEIEKGNNMGYMLYWHTVLGFFRHLKNPVSYVSKFLHPSYSNLTKAKHDYASRVNMVKVNLKTHYQDQSCLKANCPFKLNGECNKNFIFDNIPLNVKIKHTPPIKIENKGTKYTMTIEEMRNEIIKDFDTALNNSDNKIHIWKAPTGIGKTYCYLKTIGQNKDVPVCVALPTHDLINEKINEYMEINNESQQPFKTLKRPEFFEPYESMLKHYESIGLFGQTKKVFETWCNKLKTKYIDDFYTDETYTIKTKKIDESSLDEKTLNKLDEIGNYFTTLASIEKQDKLIFTTHAKMEHISKSNKNINKYIIDEDCTVNSLFKMQIFETCDIKLLQHDLNMIEDTENKYTKIKDALNKIILAQNKENTEINFGEIPDEIFEVIHRNNNYWHSPIGQLLNCETFRFDIQSNRYFGFKELKFDENKQYHIFSATPSLSILKQIYKDRIVLHDYNLNKTVGTINQYWDCKLDSRYSFKDVNKSILQLSEYIEKTKPELIVTYKHVEEKLKTLFPDVKFLHWGNVCGTNDYKDCKKAILIATPYPPSIIVEMIADKIANRKLTISKNDYMKNHVEINGFKCFITSPVDTLAKDIYLDMASGEIMQAIGRLRLTTNKNHVDLISRIPVEDAEIMSIDNIN